MTLGIASRAGSYKTRAAGSRSGRAWPSAATLRVLLESARMQILLVRSNPMVPLVSIVQPAVFLAIFLDRQGPMPAAERASTVIAVLLTCLWAATLWAAGGTLRREVADGTLARNLTGVASARLVIAGKCLGSTLLTQGLLLCTAAIAVVITHTPLALAGLPWFVLGFVLVAASGTAMGFALCSVFVLTRHALQVTSALMYPVYILAGLLIPPHFLPGPLAWLSHLISLYWLNQFLDQAAHGAFAVRPLIFLVLLTLAYFWAGGVLFGRVVDRARRKGTIDLG